MGKLILIGNRVLVEPVAKETVSAGGIYIPDDAQEKPQMARVVAAGPGSSDYKMTVAPGDNIMHGKYAGTEIELAKKKYLIMDESDILIVLGDTEDE